MGHDYSASGWLPHAGYVRNEARPLIDGDLVAHRRRKNRRLVKVGVCGACYAQQRRARLVTFGCQALHVRAGVKVAFPTQPLFAGAFPTQAKVSQAPPSTQPPRWGRCQPGRR